MVKVWVVELQGCEGNQLICICDTKERAIKELFKQRDELVQGYRKMRHMDERMYGGLINALEGDEYMEWDCYPQDTPRIYPMEVLS